MHNELYTVPTEAMQFVEFQFDRFKAPKPSRRSLDRVIDFVLTAVIKLKHFPTTQYDAVHRFNNPGEGLYEIERYQILGKLEVEIRQFLRIPPEEISINQLHLATWGTIMFAWSAQGQRAVDWYKNVVMKEESHATAPKNRYQRLG